MPFTTAPVSNKPAATSIARWKASVEADFAAAWTSGETVSDGWFKGATAARKLRESVSAPGTLCAIDPAPQPADMETDLPFVELGGRTLSSLLDRDAEARRN